MMMIILPERIERLLKKEKLLSPYAVLTTPPLIFEHLGLSAADVQIVRQHYAAKSFPGFVIAYDLAHLHANKYRHITFGCAALDRLTRNGVPVRGLTEFVGAAGVGKSQLCMQLALMVQLPVDMGGLGRGAVYVCTEGGPFPSQRLYGMIAAVQTLFGRRVREVPFSSRVFLEHLHDASSLLHCISTNLPLLMAQYDIGLIVIDSVAAVFRTETEDYQARAQDMRTLVRRLLKLSDQYCCAVVCVNHVTTCLPDETSVKAVAAAATTKTTTTRERLVPCLGLAWANLVTTRLQVQRKRKGNADVDVRSIEVIFSPEMPPGRANFRITGDGVVDVP